uniref:DC1 domain-containing protein n=1 Tax=Populus trichocarpa TaxID=3694 RepID=A0A2K1XAM9_POPTR
MNTTLSLYATCKNSIFDCRAHQLAHIDHPLIMNEEQEYHGEGVMCSVCAEAMSGPSDCCTFSKFFLQKKCAELPLEIKWHLHTLHLLAKPPSHYSRCVCDKSFARHCCFCELTISIVLFHRAFLNLKVRNIKLFV